MEYRDLTTQKVTLSTTSAQSSAISDSVYKIRLIATANVHFKIGVNPTATDSDAYLTSGDFIYLGISPGEKVAIRTVTGGGNAFITPLSQ